MSQIKVEGMRCQNCVNAVLEAVTRIPGLHGVVVNLEQGQVSWEDDQPDAPVDIELVKKAIQGIGFLVR